MNQVQELQAKAERFAARAAAAKRRTARNTYLSLEQSCRTLAANEEQAEASRSDARKAAAAL